jgi:hypothetical protein
MSTKSPLRNKSVIQTATSAAAATSVALLIALAVLSVAKASEQHSGPTTILCELRSPLVPLRLSIGGYDWSSEELSGQNSTIGPTFPICCRPTS